MRALLFIWLAGAAWAGPFCHLTYRQTAPGLTSGGHWRSAGGNPIRPPRGVGQQDFEFLVSQLRDAPELVGVEMLVLHGSRTHFSYGYGPEERSDLDWKAFYGGNRTPEQRVYPQLDLEKRLSGASKSMGVPVESGLPTVHSMDEALSPSDKSPLSNGKNQEEARQIYAELSARAAAENWDRGRLKREYIQAIGPGSVHREALVLVRDDANAPARLQRLRELGYTNLLLVSFK